jgi:hypothetical protein
MSSLAVQRFEQSGTWVKPPGAVRVDITLKGGDGGASTPGGGGGKGGDSTFILAASLVAGGGGGAGAATSGPPVSYWQASRGGEGATVTASFAASELPPEMAVTVGRGGFASIVTHVD